VCGDEDRDTGFGELIDQVPEGAAGSGIPTRSDQAISIGTKGIAYEVARVLDIAIMFRVLPVTELIIMLI